MKVKIVKLHKFEKALAYENTQPPSILLETVESWCGNEIEVEKFERGSKFVWAEVETRIIIEEWMVESDYKDIFH